MLNKRALFATTTLVATLGLASVALAQSSATSELEQDYVTPENDTVSAVQVNAGQSSIGGGVRAETVPKSRASINQAFISRQQAGQSVFQSLNQVPGFNFTNNDPYGNSGGNVRIRGFDGARVSLTFDGVPLNDTGNYAIFTNQLLDSEVIETATVNMGTTDVDSPTASATGGTVNVGSRKPPMTFGATLQASEGSFDYHRFLGMLDTGELWGTGAAATIEASRTKYLKFKGPGELQKTQVNILARRLIGDNGDFFSFGLHYNENRNAFYRNLSFAQLATLGYHADNDATCTRIAAVKDTGQTDNLCTNFYGVRDNPSNTGNIRGQLKLHAAPNLIFTLDPSFQYVLANGGGYTSVAESDGRLKGKTTTFANCSTGSGADLNGDGDCLDTVGLYTPNTTNTYRYGYTTSLIWDLNANNRLRAAITGDYGHHRQSGEYTFLDAVGNPLNVFGGKDDFGPKVMTADGSWLQGRDRYSEAFLTQTALEYRGEFMDGKLVVNLGARYPKFTRNLHQYCYTQKGSSNVRCTTENPASGNADGTVNFAGVANTYIRPFHTNFSYSKVLPSVGIDYTISDAQSLYASYAGGLSAPRTDNLYTATIVNGEVVLPGVQPETTQAWDLGWRYGSNRLIVQAALWYNTFQNRIATSFDPLTGISIDRNVGSVKLYGLDTQLGFRVTPAFFATATVSYNHSALQDNVQVGTSGAGPLYLPTKGKTLVETPTWTYGARIDWSPTSALHLGLQGKRVSKRFSTDVNDQYVDGYTVVDLDARYDLPIGNSFLQFNVTNLFDEQYLGSISSQTNAVAIPGIVGASTPTYAVAAPRAYSVTLRAKF
ncbi:MAG: TonB-dependent receptor [Caulobacteraceae bacterium]|nr:TonB-dependent receptor [Caulobacteraceae bacterium]